MNQPLVNGHGPLVIINSKPVNTVSDAHDQAIIQPRTRRIVDKVMLLRCIAGPFGFSGESVREGLVAFTRRRLVTWL